MMRWSYHMEFAAKGTPNDQITTLLNYNKEFFCHSSFSFFFSPLHLFLFLFVRNIENKASHTLGQKPLDFENGKS